eukprot:scaffold79771_cov28-Tisochrysis_lutea.AAC.5
MEANRQRVEGLLRRYRLQRAKRRGLARRRRRRERRKRQAGPRKGKGLAAGGGMGVRDGHRAWSMGYARGATL